PGHAELAADAILDGLAGIRIVAKELFGVFATLTEPFAAVREPCAALLDDPLVDRQIEQVAGARYAFAVHDVEFGFAKWRRHFVLHNLHAGAAADHGVAVLDAGNAADVHPDRRVEFQCPAAGGGFRVAEHHADLLPQLVDEDEAGFRFRDHAGELSERLRHQPRLQSHLRFAHLAFDFRPRHECRHRIDDDDVDAARADEDFDDFKRLLAVVGLR